MLGSKRLNEIIKADIDLHLVKLAAEGYSQNLVASVRKWSHSVFEEAVDNDSSRESGSQSGNANL